MYIISNCLNFNYWIFYLTLIYLIGKQQHEKERRREWEKKPWYPWLCVLMCVLVVRYWSAYYCSWYNHPLLLTQHQHPLKHQRHWLCLDTIQKVINFLVIIPFREKCCVYYLCIASIYSQLEEVGRVRKDSACP